MSARLFASVLRVQMLHVSTDTRGQYSVPPIHVQSLDKVQKENENTITEMAKDPALVLKSMLELETLHFNMSPLILFSQRVSLIILTTME